ncbi:hypothetical protein P9112_010499 [Eukaryota sp. TZLM1-RC]
MRPSMLQRLGQNRHSYSLTLDLWTSRAKRPYLGITAHFVSDDFNLSSLTLDVSIVPSVANRQLTFLESFLRRSHAEGDELSTFLSEAPVDLSVNPLQWWNDNKRRFPVLSQIAADFLAIQPTSVPCERLFSLAGDMVSEKRCCLADDSVRAVLCLRSWLENGFDLI